MYQFDFYSVGIDWATGSVDYSVAIVMGYKQIEKTDFYAPYIICELAAAPTDFIDENDKINQYIEEFAALYDNFIGFENATYHYDHNAETAMSVIQKGLADKYDIFIKKQKAIKHASNVNKDAGLADRVVWLKSLLSSGWFYAQFYSNWGEGLRVLNEQQKVLNEQLEELRFSENQTNIPDPKMPQDAIDALFYATYPYNNVIPNKNNALGKKTLFLSV